MKSFTTFFIGLFFCSMIFAQNANPSDCFNGKRDSTEGGVDCVKGLPGPGGCMSCNGEADILLNGKNYQTGVITTQVYQTPSKTILNRPGTGAIFVCRFFTEGTPQSGVSLIFYFDNKINKPGTYKVKSLTKDFKLQIMYNRSGGAQTPEKVKEATLRITEVNQIERKLTADFVVIAKLPDGTPINLTGNLTNVGF